MSRIVELQGEQTWVAMTGIEAGSPGDKMPWSPSMGLVHTPFQGEAGRKRTYTLPAVEIAQTNEKGRSDVEVRLVPPAGVTELVSGDYVEGMVALLLFPDPAETYTGPNEALKKALATMGSNWQMIFREARENHTVLTMETGKLLENLPPVIRVDHHEKAVFKIKGGLGYLPVTFTGLKAIADYEVRIGDGQTSQVFDQSVHGKDFWQASYDAGSKTWSRTYNFPMDREGGSLVEVEFQRTR